MDSLRKSFGEPELLSEAEGNGWRPEKGADKVDAHKGSSLLVQGLPSILQLHLKRFNYDWQRDTMVKLNNRFTFPDVLDLSSICKDMEQELESQAIFDLQSVVVHVGEYGVGHYYSYVRPDVRTDEWYRFNDDAVEKVNFQEVMDDAFGGLNEEKSIPPAKKQSLLRRLFSILQGSSDVASYGWGGSSSNAYVLQYVKRSDIPLLYPDNEC